VTSTSEPNDVTARVPPPDALEVLLRFGALMLQAGNTAVRTRGWIDAIAPQLGFEGVTVNASPDSITVSVRHGNGWLTAIREIGPPGVNVLRIAQLEGVLLHRFDLDEIAEYRAEWGFFRDRRTDLYAKSIV